MKSWKRATLVSFVLIGATISFAYWSTNQFNQAFDNLSDSNLANTPTPSSSSRKTAGLASTSPKISGKLATSTGPQY